MSRRALARGVALIGLLLACTSTPNEGAQGERILVFSKTAGYRHASIEDAVVALRSRAAEAGIGFDATEDAGAFTRENLALYDAVVFLSTTGDVLAPSQQSALEAFVADGGGFAGIHSATATLPDPWIRVDEWYDFQDVQPGRSVLLEIDETSYKSPAENPAPEPRPIAWYQQLESGRSFFTALGHTSESWADPHFLDHVWGGVRWALGG